MFFFFCIFGFCRLGSEISGRGNLISELGWVWSVFCKFVSAGCGGRGLRVGLNLGTFPKLVSIGSGFGFRAAGGISEIG